MLRTALHYEVLSTFKQPGTKERSGRTWTEPMNDLGEDERIEGDFPRSIGLVPIGKKKDVKFRTREGVEGLKEKVVGKFRACLLCKIIASEEQFFDDGCPNCPLLELNGSRSNVWDCTTPNYSGMIAVLKPEASWAAKFNRIERGIPGCYAVEVYGELPERIRDLAG